jgi:hypothetical protein
MGRRRKIPGLYGGREECEGARRSVGGNGGAEVPMDEVIMFVAF